MHVLSSIGTLICMSFNITLIDSCIHSLLSLAHAARLHEYVRPEMTEENKIDIRQGRWEIKINVSTMIYSALILPITHLDIQSRKCAWMSLLLMMLAWLVDWERRLHTRLRLVISTTVRHNMMMRNQPALLYWLVQIIPTKASICDKYVIWFLHYDHTLLKTEHRWHWLSIWHMLEGWWLEWLLHAYWSNILAE